MLWPMATLGSLPIFLKVSFTFWPLLTSNEFFEYIMVSVPSRLMCTSNFCLEGVSSEYVMFGLRNVIRPKPVATIAVDILI